MSMLVTSRSTRGPCKKPLSFFDPSRFPRQRKQNTAVTLPGSPCPSHVHVKESSCGASSHHIRTRALGSSRWRFASRFQGSQVGRIGSLLGQTRVSSVGVDPIDPSRSDGWILVEGVERRRVSTNQQAGRASRDVGRGAPTWRGWCQATDAHVRDRKG